MAVVGNLGRTRPAWGPDILARRIVKCDREILELAAVVAALGSCGKTTGLDRLAEGLGDTSLASYRVAYEYLVIQADPVCPPVWHVVGPFADPERAGIQGLYGPERGAEPGQSFPNRQGGTASWSTVEPDHGILTFPEGPEPAVYFALARLTARHGARLGLLFSNRDGIAAWIDGEKIVEEPEREAASIFLPYYLPGGTHTILLEISRRRAAAAAGCHILDPAGVIAFEEG